MPLQQLITPEEISTIDGIPLVEYILDRPPYSRFDWDGSKLVVRPTIDPMTGVMSFGPQQVQYTVVEVSPYQTVPTTRTVIAGPCELAGYDCITAAGTIAIYDGTNTSGAISVPTTTLTVGC